MLISCHSSMNFKTEQRKQESWPVQKFRQLVTTSKHTFTLISQLLTVLLFLIWKFSPNPSSVQSCEICSLYLSALHKQHVQESFQWSSSQGTVRADPKASACGSSRISWRILRFALNHCCIVVEARLSCSWQTALASASVYFCYLRKSTKYLIFLTGTKLLHVLKKWTNKTHLPKFSLSVLYS